MRMILPVLVEDKLQLLSHSRGVGGDGGTTTTTTKTKSRTSRRSCCSRLRYLPAVMMAHVLLLLLGSMMSLVIAGLSPSQNFLVIPEQRRCGSGGTSFVVSPPSVSSSRRRQVMRVVMTAFHDRPPPRQQQHGQRLHCSSSACIYNSTTTMTASSTSTTAVNNNEYPASSDHHDSLFPLRGGGGRNGSGGRPQTNLLQLYSYWIDTNPIRTKAWTAGIVAALADIVTQKYILATAFSFRRVVALALAGLGFVGPYLHVWYGHLDRLLVSIKHHGPRTLIKMVLDQTIGVAIFFPMYFTSYEIALALVHGRWPHWLYGIEKCRADLWSIALMNWRIWPIVNIVNFGFVPLQFQVLVNQIFAFFWCIYISTRI